MNRHKTDFTRVLDELADMGLGEEEVAQQTGIEKRLIRKLRWGVRKQPAYDDGCAIMELYNRACKKKVA